MADLTIDLATLNVTKNGPKLHQHQEPDLESLGSEDDGPPDFTLNMEKWMRGTEKWKKEGGRIENNAQNDEGQIGEGKESVGGESMEEERKRDMEDPGEESDFLPSSASTPAPYIASKENVREASRPADTRSIAHQPSSRLNTEAVETTASDEVSNQLRDLQIKIEQLQMQDGKHQLVKSSLQLENSTLRDEIDGLKDELSDMRNAISKMRQQVKLTDKERESERKSQEEAKSKVGSLQDKLEPVLQDLAIARSTAEVEKRHSEAKIMALEAKLLSTQENFMKQQIDSRYAQEIKNNENLKLKSELDICKGEARAYQHTLHTREEDHRAAVTVLHKKLDAGHEAQSRADVLKMELDHALEQLAETRRNVDTVEDENDRLTQENERQRDELNATTTILSAKDASLGAAKSTIDQLRDEISRIKGEKNIGLIGEDVHDAEIEQLRQQHRAEIRAAQVVHEQKQKDLNANILRVQEGMRRQGARLQKTHREEIASLGQEIAALKSRLKKAPADPPAATVAEYRNAIRMLSTQLNVANETILSTRHTLAEAHKSLAISTSDVDRLNKQFDAFKTALKNHYRDRLQQQELEWRKKINAVLKDRELIVKQLFVKWSKGEWGISPEGEKQPCRIKYFKKNGERITEPGQADKSEKCIPQPGEKQKDGERAPLPGEKGKDGESIPQPKEKDKREVRILSPAEKGQKDQRSVKIAEKDQNAPQTQSAAAAAVTLQYAKNEALVQKLTEKYQNDPRIQSAAEDAKNEVLIQKLLAKHHHHDDQPQPSAAASAAASAALELPKPQNAPPSAPASQNPNPNSNPNKPKSTVNPISNPISNPKISNNNEIPPLAPAVANPNPNSNFKPLTRQEKRARLLEVQAHIDRIIRDYPPLRPSRVRLTNEELAQMMRDVKESQRRLKERDKEYMEMRERHYRRENLGGLKGLKEGN